MKVGGLEIEVSSGLAHLCRSPWGCLTQRMHEKIGSPLSPEQFDSGAIFQQGGSLPAPVQPPKPAKASCLFTPASVIVF
jgi:hypothetical protein